MGLRTQLVYAVLTVSLSSFAAACFGGPALVIHTDGPPVAQAPAVVVPAGYVLTEPIDCSGTDEIHLENAYINTLGPAIIARDACTITLVNSQIISQQSVALQASGAGDIVLQGCLVQGAAGAIQITGASDVTATSSTIVGAVTTSEAGDFHASPDTALRSY